MNNLNLNSFSNKLKDFFKSHKKTSIFIQTVFILIVASMQFLQLQYSTSRVLNKLSILVITGNVFVLLLFNVIIIFFVRKRSIAFLISSFFITVLSIVNYYVASFHGNPFMFSELSNFKTALDVAGNYKYSINGIVLKILFAFVFELSIVFLEIHNIFSRRYPREWSYHLPVSRKTLLDSHQALLPLCHSFHYPQHKSLYRYFQIIKGRLSALTRNLLFS